MHTATVDRFIFQYRNAPFDADFLFKSINGVVVFHETPLALNAELVESVYKYCKSENAYTTTKFTLCFLDARGTVEYCKELKPKIYLLRNMTTGDYSIRHCLDVVLNKALVQDILENGKHNGVTKNLFGLHMLRQRIETGYYRIFIAMSEEDGRSYNIPIMNIENDALSSTVWNKLYLDNNCVVSQVITSRISNKLRG